MLRGAETHLAALNVDDGAEGAFKRAATAAIEGAKIGGDELAEIFPANGGDRLGVEVGLLVQEIVERLQAAVNGIVQQVAPGFFDFPFHDGNARIQELLYIGRNVREKGEVAADVEAADQNGKAGAPKGMSKIASAWELIGLHADEADDGLGEAPALGTADAFDGNLVDRFIEQVDLDVPGVAQALLPDNIFRQPGQAGERVARKNAAKVAHHITVIIILGRLDEIEVKSFAHFAGPSRDQIRGRERSRRDTPIVAHLKKRRKANPARNRQSVNVQNCTLSAASNCCSVWMGQEDNHGEAAGKGELPFEEAGHDGPPRKGYRMAKSGTFRLLPVF